LKFIHSLVLATLLVAATPALASTIEVNLAKGESSSRPGIATGKFGRKSTIEYERPILSASLISESRIQESALESSEFFGADRFTDFFEQLSNCQSKNNHNRGNDLGQDSGHAVDQGGTQVLGAVVATPEPESLGLLLVGLIFLGTVLLIQGGTKS
jgi:hypothetical protein